MPITLNHSNINVQYSSDKSYIIETVKSDLYRRNENVDTVIRNNIQAAPVTPTTYVDSSGNVYAVESYTYSGTANTADYTRVFPKNTTCDILIVGGGGGGGPGHGGGGGAGQLILIHQATLNGTYTINVGKGGIGGRSSELANSFPATKGRDSVFGTVIAEGGGANTNVSSDKNGGSGAGGDGYNTDGGTSGFGNKNTTIDSFPGAVLYSRGNNGGSNTGSTGGGGGGAGTAGAVGSTTSPFSIGGDGLSGISDINYDFKTNFGNYGKLESDGKYWFAGGGGGGASSTSAFGGKGGGGDGSNNSAVVGNAMNNTGSGGGGGAGGSGSGGSGGSGIVIIKYLLGTIPTTNFLTNEPVVTAPIFTETIRTFVHSGGTEAQTTYNITVPQNTICDILMIGGGGGGGKDRAGGGGAGALILSIGNILSGTYNIRVGNGSLGATTGVNAVNGYDSEIYNSNGTIIFRAKGGGGGQSLNDPQAGSGAPDGGCGGGKVSQFTGLGGNAVTTNIVNGTTTGPVVTTTYGVYGNDGGRNTTGWNGSNGDAMDGAGGGGIGQGGTDAGALGPVDSQFVTNAPGKGGDGLYFATINGNTYNFKNYFNVNGVQDGTSGNFFIGGGGGGGGGNSGIGGNGGGGAGGTQNIVGVSATGYGSGGGGAGAGNANGGNGSAGIVVIKLRTIVNAAIPEGNPITYKTLNFTFNQDNIVAYYKFNNSSSLGIDSNPSSTKYNLTPTIVGGTGGYNTSIAVEGASFQATNDGDYLEGSFPIRSIYDNSTTGISVSCWFYRKSGTTYDNPYATTLFVFYTNPSDKEFSVSLAHYNNVYTINWATTYVAYGNETYCSGFGPAQTLDTWYHLVISLNKSGIFKAYLNGVNLNLSNTSGTPRINTSGSSAYPLPEFPNVSKLKIFNPSSSGSKFSGNIDEFYVFNKEISQDEITSLYNKTFSIPINQYTLNFPVPTLTDINNNSNIVLNGAYDISLNTSNALIIPKNNQYIPKPTEFTTSNLSLRYNILNPILDPVGAQWTYSSNNTNVYNIGSVGIGTSNPQYSLDINGTLNAKEYFYNGVQIGRLSEGMVANVQHLTYTHMEVKNNTGWDAINDDLATGFVISITPKSNLSKILVNLVAHIGLTNANDGRWWGFKLYRKIGTAGWAEVTGPNGTETGASANTAGTPVWISNNMGTVGSYNERIINLTGTYLDSPNTTSIVYYTAYWNQRMADNPSRTGELWLNRAGTQNDAYRPAPSSSWTLKEIWYG